MKRRFTATLSAAALLAGSALVTLPAASALVPAPHGATTASQEPISDNAGLVNAWYLDFFGRQAYGDAGAQYWVDRLNVQAPADVLWAITHSREYTNITIDDDYENFLDRPSGQDSGYWFQGAGRGDFPLEWVEQNILASPEYARLNGGNASASQVYEWYYDVLDNAGRPGVDRSVSSGEISYWQQRILAVGALGALRELWYTPEAVQVRITDTYEYLLGRDPSAGEVSYWAPKEVESEINVDVLIASTPEYRAS